MLKGFLTRFKKEKFEEMAMYVSLEGYAISLGANITKTGLEEFLNSPKGNNLKINISHAKKTYGNIPILEMLELEIKKQPYAWNHYSTEDKALILNLINLLDQVDINWI